MVLKLIVFAVQLLHGREVPGLLSDHNRLLPLTDGCGLRELLDHPVHTHWRQGALDRGVLIPAQGRVSSACRSCQLPGVSLYLSGSIASSGLGSQPNSSTLAARTNISAPG